MRSLIVATLVAVLALAAAPATAFTDFPAMSGTPKKTIHPETGNTHYEHEVDHQFPATNTFFKAKYTAEHESHWNIIQLHEHIEGMKDVHCGLGAKGEIDTLRILKPSKTLLDQVHQQKATGYSHTVITAQGKHHCKGKGIFRQLTSVKEDATTGAITLVVKATGYNKIFKNLNLRIDTNHIHQKKPSSVKLPPKPVFNPYAADPNTFQSANRHPLQHAMSTQWGFFSAIAHACSNAVHAVAHACSDAAHTVEHAVVHAAHVVEHGVVHAADVVKNGVVHAADDVANAVSDFTVDHTFDLPGANFNKDVTKHFEAYNMITGDYKLAASFTFHPTVTFILDIHRFSLQNIECYLTGVTTMGITGSFSTTLSKDFDKKIHLTTIDIDPVTFAIGPVPVWMTPSVPIYAGFDLSLGGEVSFNAVVSASSTVQFGFAHAPSTGYRTIKSHDFKFTHDFGPLEYKADIGLKLFVEPVLNVEIESVGNVNVGVFMYGDIEVESSNACLFDLSLKASPQIALNAGLDISLLDHSIWKDDFGPWTLYSTTIPLYSMCKPLHGAAIVNTVFDRQMDAQASTPSKKVVTTVLKKLGGNSIGKSWVGSSQTLQDGHTVTMDYGAQFTVGETVNSTLVYITLAKSMKTPGQPSSFSGELTANAVMAYTSPDLPEVGKTLTFTWVPTNNATYNFAGNRSVLSIEPSKKFTWTIDTEDVRFVSMVSDMTYGTVAMIGPKSNNDTSSFNVFSQGYGTPLILGLDKTDITAIVIYASVATVALLVVSILAVFFFKKFRTVSRRTVASTVVVAKSAAPTGETLSAQLINGNDEEVSADI